MTLGLEMISELLILQLSNYLVDRYYIKYIYIFGQKYMYYIFHFRSGTLQGGTFLQKRTEVSKTELTFGLQLGVALQNETLKYIGFSEV